MFIYLSKKIAIPNGVKLRSVSWNSESGWIACGGENGLLKVLKLESQIAKDPRARGVAAPSNLSMNQTLEGHNGAVMVVCWNDHHRKLTTSDQYGLIIVWMLHKGMWFEEMINNRNKSVVRDMQWTSDGQKICIIYQDGAVIVGSVDGNRLWGRELAHELAFVEWSPDSRNLLFVTTAGEIFVYDALGQKIMRVPSYALQDTSGNTQVAEIHWYDGTQGSEDPNAPSLAIGFENGRVQLMRSVFDDAPIIIDATMRLTRCRWNHNGTVLALAGTQSTTSATGEKKDISQVQFYTPMGMHVRTLKVPGSGISALTWEGGSLRIALAVDSYVYFANIRPDYKWASFGSTVVYAFNKPERPEHCVVFWDTNTNERYIKYVKQLMSIHAAGENCVLATRTDDNSGQYCLILCNAIGSPVDSKYIDIQPLSVTMTDFHIIAANEDQIYVWHYRTSVSKLTSVETSTSSLRRKDGRERIFHIDDAAGTAGTAIGPSGDAICSIVASQKHLLVARERGDLYRYTLPHIALDKKYKLRCRPQQMAINCDSTKLSIIDVAGMLSFFDMEARSTGPDGRTVDGEHLVYERKDSWSMLWAKDNPDLFAVMEKTRMYILRGTEPEEPVLSSGYLMSFEELCIKAVLMDEVMTTPTQPDKSYIVNYESRSLRDARHLLNTNGTADATQFIEDNAHPRLWRLLAEMGLEKLDMNTAEKGFVMCGDYQGIQFVKRLRMLDSKSKQRAEIAVYFQRFDEAEELYLEMDRRDLAIELRTRLGDWFQVVQLVQKGDADDEVLEMAYNRIGDYYADRQKWRKAAQHYTMAKNPAALLECLYLLEDYDGIIKLIDTLPEGDALLQNVGSKLQSVGITEAAVRAFLHGGDVKGAVDCCVLLNQWDKAVELAEAHDFPQIEGLLSKYASRLLEDKKTFAAIELYRKANRSTESAKLLAHLAAEVGDKKVNPLRAKKLFVLAALEVERYRKQTLDMTNATMAAATATGTTTGTRAGGTITNATAATLDTLLQQDGMTTGVGDMGKAARTLDAAWHGAEAFHFFLMTQRQLNSGLVDQAMRTALILQHYEDILDPVDVQSLIAIASFHNSYLGTCSKAFMQLESNEALSPAQREEYAALALSIFMQHSPEDPSAESPFDRDVRPRKYCIVSGRPVKDSRFWRCKQCSHIAILAEIRGISFCPLCHAAT